MTLNKNNCTSFTILNVKIAFFILLLYYYLYTSDDSAYFEGVIKGGIKPIKGGSYR